MIQMQSYLGIHEAQSSGSESNVSESDSFLHPKESKNFDTVINQKTHAFVFYVFFCCFISQWLQTTVDME